MRHRLMREGKPTPALIISVIALIFAVGGSYAIAKKGGDKKSDKKIANKVVTKRAPGLSVGHAKTADNATNAANATNADNAKVATDLSYAKPYKFFVGPTSGADFLTIGPFTWDLVCQINSGGTDFVTMEIRSSVDHAMFDANDEETDMVAGTKYLFEETSISNPNPEIEISSFNSDGGFAPDGSVFSSAGPVLTINAPGHVGQCGASGVFFSS